MAPHGTPSHPSHAAGLTLRQTPWLPVSDVCPRRLATDNHRWQAPGLPQAATPSPPAPYAQSTPYVAVDRGGKGYGWASSCEGELHTALVGITLCSMCHAVLHCWASPCVRCVTLYCIGGHHPVFDVSRYIALAMVILRYIGYIILRCIPLPLPPLPKRMQSSGPHTCQPSPILH